LLSQIFSLNSISNLKIFLWRKLFLSSKPSQPYFISKFSSLGRTFLERSNLNEFEYNSNSLEI
jgi:hypothetical protein